MESIRRVGRRRLWNRGFVELWDFAYANRNHLMRAQALSFLLGSEVKADTLLYRFEEAREEKLPLGVLEFIRFGGKTARRNDSLRFEPNLPYLNSANEERWREIDEYKQTVATLRLVIPSFVLQEIFLLKSDLSIYVATPSLGEPGFWEPADISLTKHFILRDENSRQWKTVQKLRRLGFSSLEARVVLGANVYQEIWIQGDRAAFAHLFSAERFLHPQTFELVGQIHDLVKKYQPEFLKIRVH